MSNKVLVLVLVFVSVVVIHGGQAYGGITLEGSKCGQKVCKLSEYCSNFDSTCQPCSEVCDLTGHNYEKTLCENQCQDYLHDLRYVQNTGRSDDDLRATVKSLSRTVTVTLTFVIIVLFILLAVLIFQLYRWKVKKNITLQGIRNKFFKKTNNPASVPTHNENKKKDLRLEIPSPTVASDFTPVTVSTSIDRRPAEDSTLDYAYDNPAMTKNINNSF